MWKTKNKAARSCCAVILAICIFFMAVNFTLPVNSESEHVEDGYRYAVTIEFGAMSFYYDYGTWDVNEMRYVADSASVFPASGTESGFPGWYGFDGITNKISITYVNSYDESTNQNINISLTYRPLTADEAADVGGGQVVDGVTMSFYADSDLKTVLSPSFVFQNGIKKELYASLSGVPQTSGGKYESGPFSPVGMITIQIGDFSD